jgi:hypothetical protein
MSLSPRELVAMAGNSPSLTIESYTMAMAVYRVFTETQGWGHSIGFTLVMQRPDWDLLRTYFVQHDINTKPIPDARPYWAPEPPIALPLPG